MPSIPRKPAHAKPHADVKPQANARPTAEPKTADLRPVSHVVERVQTGVRLEKRLLKVLKGLAEYLDLSLGDLLEGVTLHALENKPPFEPATLAKIADLKRIYDLDLTAEDSHRLREG
jgi:hypothetical protein